MGRIKRDTTILAVLVALGVSACAGADSDSSGADFNEADARASTDSASGAPAREFGESEESTDDLLGEPDVVADVGQATAGSRAPSAPLDVDGFGRAVAVEAGVVVGTPNIRQAVDDALIVVRRNNASVFDADVNIGDELEDGSIDGSGRLTIKVPPIDLDPLIADLDGTAGTLLARTQTSEDVTEQLVDLDIRLRVERTTIEQFETLLAQATAFNDIVTIQQVITEHTIVLEQLLASQRNVEQRVDLSTLTIDLVYVAPVVEVIEDPIVDDDSGIADAFSKGWDTFVGIMFALGLVLAITAPFLAVVLVVLALVLLVTRRRRPRSTAPTFTTAVPQQEKSEQDVLAGPTPGE
jgi:hypothetical protein